ncbi:hypothetical protein EON65_42900 [archaeon]|nr:MAG: hypothetical protein EON65_42900 [archaeon]
MGLSSSCLLKDRMLSSKLSRRVVVVHLPSIANGDSTKGNMLRLVYNVVSSMQSISSKNLITS